MITLTSKDYSYILIKDLNLAPNKTGTIDENVLVLSELKSIENLYLIKKIDLSSQDLAKVRSRIDGLDGNEGGGDSPIQSISLNGNPLTPDNNKNVNINVSSVGGGGINVVDYYPEDNVIITGPTLVTSSEGAIWDGVYLSSDNNEENVLALSGSENTINVKYVSVKLPLPSSGSISIDASDTIKRSEIQSTVNGETTTSVISQQIIMVCLKPNETVGSFYTKFYNASGSFPFATFNVVKNSSEVLNGNALYSSSLAGNNSDNFTVPNDGKLVFHFMNYIEYAIQLQGVTLEQIYSILTPEQIAIYSTIRVIVISKPDTPLTSALGYLVVDPELTDLHFAIGSIDLGEEDNLFPESKLKVDASIREYILPESITDGTYLNIKENVTLLGHQLKANDFFLLYGNLTKGIPIQISSTDGPSPTGTFRGYLTTEPSNPEDGDWYVKSVYVSQNNSYSNLMYVWVSNRSAWELVGFIPNNSGGSLTGLNYNGTSNRITNSNGYNLAGYLGSFSSQPTPTSYYESSIYYNTSTQKFYYYSYGTWYECPTGQNLNLIDLIDSNTNFNSIPYTGAVRDYINLQKLSYIDPVVTTSDYLSRLPTVEAIKNYTAYGIPANTIKEKFNNVPAGCEVLLKKYSWKLNYSNYTQLLGDMADGPLKYATSSGLVDMDSQKFGVISGDTSIVFEQSRTSQSVVSYLQNEFFNSFSINVEVSDSEEIRELMVSIASMQFIFKFGKSTITEQHTHYQYGTLTDPVSFTRFPSTNFIISLEKIKINSSDAVSIKVYRAIINDFGKGYYFELLYETTTLLYLYNAWLGYFSIGPNSVPNPIEPIKLKKILLTTLDY